MSQLADGFFILCLFGLIGWCAWRLALLMTPRDMRDIDHDDDAF